MQHSNARKVGSDIELFGTPMDAPHDLMWWSNWMQTLSAIPDKGTRLDLGDGYWTHRDGLSAEYGFEPTTSLDQFMMRLSTGKRLVESTLGHELYAVTSLDVSAIIHEPWAESLLDMGCSPDYLATDSLQMVRRSVPSRVRREPRRECGGHIHISLPDPFIQDRALQCQFVRELDSVVHPLAAADMGITARSWYRRRNVFRPTAYGIEYRTLGAGALFAPNAELFLGLVFDMVHSVWEV